MNTNHKSKQHQQKQIKKEWGQVEISITHKICENIGYL